MLRIPGTALLLLACLVAPDSPAAPRAAWADGEAPDVPAGARLRLEPERTMWRLGENILVRYILENAGDTPIAVDWGADNRAVRPVRTRVEVLDAQGVAMEDPTPDPWCFGGIGGRAGVTMSRPFVLEVPVLRYRLIPRPGRYRIRVFHDLGWNALQATQGRGWDAVPADDDPRWAETTIEVFEPPADGLGAVLDAMMELDEPGHQTYLRRNRAWSDLGVLRHPAYLPVLVERLQSPHGGRHAAAWLEGLRSIATQEATTALVDLLEQGGGADRAAAVVERVPAPGPVPILIDHLQGFGFAHREAARLAPAWDPALAPRVRAWATRTLLGGTFTPHDQVLRAAYLLAAVGEPEDLPAVEAGLRHALDASRSSPAVHADPGHRAQLRELYAAAVLLFRRGAPPPEDPQTPEAIALALLWMHAQGPGSVPRFEPRLVAWTAHPDVAVRDLLLRSLPRPLPAGVVDALGGLLDTDDLQLRISVLRAMTDARDPRFAGVAAEQLGQASDFMAIEIAEGAAAASGVGVVERLRRHAAALDVESTFGQRWGKLTSVFAEGSRVPRGQPDEAERARLRAAWRVFLEAHGEAIAAGARFAPDDPAVQALLPVAAAEEAEAR